ncbi:MAG: hypothetical protein K0Q66_1405 [Chitinophagaceae bacterium]|nr:hypothetical protein [Chitinophagaceae bacterium]
MTLGFCNIMMGEIVGQATNKDGAPGYALR